MAPGLQLPVKLLSKTTCPRKVNIRVLLYCRGHRYTFEPIFKFQPIMSNTYVRDQASEIRALNTLISELENQYAELFLDGGTPELLKRIHFELEELKRELQRIKR